MKGNVENLATLCLDKIDCDRLALKRQIEESLLRLEKESLISRSGDVYCFLTNEERDINREIKRQQVSSAEEAEGAGGNHFRRCSSGIKRSIGFQNQERYSLQPVV